MKKTFFNFPLVALLTLVMILAVGVFSARADAEVVSSEPAPGTQLSESPEQIRITFSEPVESQTTFVVTDTKFNEVNGVTPQVDPEHQEQVYSSIPRLDPGLYTVQWSAVTNDGGKTSGKFSFAVVETSSLRPSVLIVDIILALIILGGVVWAIRKRAT